MSNSGLVAWVERVTSAFAVITTDHALIHEGKAFTLARTTQELPGDGSMCVLFKTPKVDSAHSASHVVENGEGGTITWTAVEAGAEGNAFRIAHSYGVSDQALGVSYDPTEHTVLVYLGCDMDGVPNSDAADVVAAVQAIDAIDWVTCSFDGAGDAVAKGTDDYVFLTGGSNPVYVHFKPSAIQCSTASIVSLLENPETVPLTYEMVYPVCRNRIATTESSVVCKESLSDSAFGGIMMDTAYIPAGGQGNSKIGGQVNAAEEWVLKPDTMYALMLTNLAAGSAVVAYSLFWYEEDGA